MNTQQSHLIVATMSKHDIVGVVAVLVGLLALGLGLLRAAIRIAMLLAGAVVVIIGILLLTRTI